MKLTTFFRKTIRWRFIIAAVVPLLLITALLTTYLVQARQQDSRLQFLEASEISAAYLGDSAHIELYAGDRTRLKELANKIKNFPNLVGVAYLNSEHELISTSHGFTPPNSLLLDLPPIGQESVNDRLYLQQPIYFAGIDIEDYPENPSSKASGPILVGWVIASFDTTGNRRQQRTIVLTGVSIGFVGLVLAVLLSLYLGRSIVRPVRQLTRTVKQMEAGDLDVRAPATTTIELARLAQGINQLAESVAEGQRNLEHKVQLATWRLEHTLEDLREKNSELETARETAEAADHAKSEFLARMSHELRTPITAIQGFTRLLQNTELGDSERNYCTIINQSSSQLLNLIDDILSISRLQSNAIEIDAQPFNLIETLEQSVSQMALPAREKGLELILDIAPEVPTTVVGDGFRIAQIINNLVSNSVKFTNSGHVRTSVSTRPRDDQYIDILISVSDTGIGIPENKRDKLFQAFAQADTSITRKFGGTGLGLAIVKSLIDLMNGSIRLDSAEGKGTTFRISLPVPITAIEKGPSSIDARVVLLDEHPLSKRALADMLCRFVAELEIPEHDDDLTHLRPDAVVLGLPSSSDDATNLQKIRETLNKTDAPLLILTPSPHLNSTGIDPLNRRPLNVLNKPSTLLSLHRALQQLINGAPELTQVTKEGRLLGGLRVLIAEDNPFTREFLKTLLSREGAYCISAANGVEALEAYHREPIDIVLIDIHMPEKSGIETVREIRASENDNHNVPVIAITADVLQQEEEALADADITDLLFKPVDEQLLIERILTYCRPSTEMPELHQKLGDEIPVEQFFAEVERLVSDAALACHNQDLEGARDPVHQLLGIAGVFKLPELEVRVSNLHRAIKGHRHSQAVSALEELKEEVSRLIEANSTSRELSN